MRWSALGGRDSLLVVEVSKNELLTRLSYIFSQARRIIGENWTLPTTCIDPDRHFQQASFNNVPVLNNRASWRPHKSFEPNPLRPSDSVLTGRVADPGLPREDMSVSVNAATWWLVSTVDREGRPVVLEGEFRRFRQEGVSKLKAVTEGWYRLGTATWLVFDGEIYGNGRV